MVLVNLEPVSLESVNVTEKMIQKQIEDDPSILGLGDLELIDKERMQPKAGRLHPHSSKSHTAGEALRELLRVPFNLSAKGA